MAANNCRGGVVVVTCPTVCEEPQEISLQNVNLSGIGVLDGFSNPNGNFRGVVAGNSMVTVTLDALNHTIVITPQAAAIAGALPAATTTQVGVLETATDGEALAKSATDKIVTPSNFAAMGASTSFAGFIEIATLAEVQAGTATNLAVVPDTLADMNFLSLANGVTTTLAAAATATVSLGGGSTLLINGITPGAENIVLTNATVLLNTGGVIDFGIGQILVGGTNLPESVLGSDAVGAPTQYLISNFFTSADAQSGWGTPTGILARTTFAGLAPLTFSDPPTQLECNALGVQVSIIQQRLAALITDLKTSGFITA